MINPALLTDDLADKLAEEVICSCCVESIEWHIARRFAERTKELLDNIMPSVNELRRQAHFEKLFNSLIPYEKLYKTMLRDVWAKEEKIVIANLKKMKKSWLTKDKIDDILYPVSQFEKELSENALEIDLAIIDKQGNIEMGKLAATDVVFDVSNPEVQKWLKSYTPKFAKEFEKTSIKKLRKALMEGMAEGEGVPQLAKRINEIFKNWNKQRAVDVAQGEALRASNKANMLAYKQSGIVKKKVWITHLDDKTCNHCRRLDGKVISIEKNFFNIGDTSTVTVSRGGKQFKEKLKITYEDVDGGNLHNRCRCTVAAQIEEA